MKPYFISEEQFKALEQRVRGGVDATRTATVGARQSVRLGVERAQRSPAKDDGATMPVHNPRDTGAGSSPAPSPYKSTWEAAYAAKLDIEKAAGLIKAYYYEPFSLWLPGKVRYKPDFLIDYGIFKSEKLELIEIKGWSRNRRDGITRLKIAAALFPCFVWRMVYRTKGGGWDGEYV